MADTKTDARAYHTRAEEPGAAAPPRDFAVEALSAAMAGLDSFARHVRQAFGPRRSFALLHSAARLVEAVANGDETEARSKLEDALRARHAMDSEEVG